MQFKSNYDYSGKTMEESKILVNVTFKKAVRRKSRTVSLKTMCQEQEVVAA